MVLTLDGREVLPVGASPLNHSIGSFYSTSRGTRNTRSGSISIVRDRYVAQGFHEDVSLINHSAKTSRMRLQFSFDSDFADVSSDAGVYYEAGKVTVQEKRAAYCW
jgi:hypothetical protein